MRILLLEDDIQLGEGLAQALRQRRYAVDWLRDGQAALATMLEEPRDAMILDLGLLRCDGMVVLQTLRSRGSQLPVIILTARDAVSSRVAALDAGADDYLIKPFDIDELDARLRALIRRSHGRSAPQLERNGISLDPASNEVRFQGAVISLPRREYALLQALMEHAGQVLTRDRLAGVLYGWGEEIESNALEVHIHHLRKKLGNDSIRTIRGVGYMLPRDA